jgi:hypothetical protein
MENVSSTDQHDSRLVPVTVKHFAHKSKEIWMWNAIVLENNDFLKFIESPGNSRRNTSSATKVFIGTLPIDFARPIDHSSNDFASFSAKCCFAPPRCARAIGGHQ